jgi:hypothetical protein
MIADSGRDKIRKGEHTEEQIFSELKRVVADRIVKNVAGIRSWAPGPPCG